jgi:multiple sugar transport system ATP-binding protein
VRSWRARSNLASERALHHAQLSLDRWTSADLNGQSELLIGIRPEELGMVEPFMLGESVLRGKVSAVEPLGAETLLVVDLDGRPGELTARVHRDVQLRFDDRVALGFLPSALYLFDSQTQKAIPASVPADSVGLARLPGSHLRHFPARRPSGRSST